MSQTPRGRTMPISAVQARLNGLERLLQGASSADEAAEVIIGNQDIISGQLSSLGDVLDLFSERRQQLSQRQLRQLRQAIDSFERLQAQVSRLDDQLESQTQDFRQAIRQNRAVVARLRQQSQSISQDVSRFEDAVDAFAQLREQQRQREQQRVAAILDRLDQISETLQGRAQRQPVREALQELEQAVSRIDAQPSDATVAALTDELMRVQNAVDRMAQQERQLPQTIQSDLAQLQQMLDATLASGGETAGPGAGSGIGGGGEAGTLGQALAAEFGIEPAALLTDLPDNFIGETVEPITASQSGIATFDIFGAPFRATVTAQEDLAANETIFITGTDNRVRALTETTGGQNPAKPIERREEFNVSTDSGEDILNNDVEANTRGSRLVVTVSLDTQAVFQAQVKPRPSSPPDFTTDFNDGTALGGGEVFEFPYQLGLGAKLNYRVDTNNVTVQQIRVVEELVT